MSTALQAAADGDTAGELAALRRRVGELERHFDAVVNAVIPMGVALLHANGREHLLGAILAQAKDLCHADGGTLYLRNADDALEFVLLQNDTLGVALGGPGAEPVPYPPLPLRDPATGADNHANVATSAALTGRTVNIADAYAAEGFDFSGTRAFDGRTGYRSTSFLTVPLRANDGGVIGVLQLLNARDPATGAVVPFDAALEPIVESLSTLAAAALEVQRREENLRNRIRELRVQVDADKRERHVAAIADTDYFRDLQKRAREMRSRSR